MAKKEAYFTRARANRGVKLPLLTPEGKDEGDWLWVLGIDSDAFREAKAELNRRIVGVASLKDEAEKKRATKEEEYRLIAALVTGWSFEDPYTPEAMMELLTEAPQIARTIDDFVYSRASFFRALSGSSPDTQKAPSASESAPADLPSPSEAT